jgi:hypothetical protein
MIDQTMPIKFSSAWWVSFSPLGNLIGMVWSIIVFSLVTLQQALPPEPRFNFTLANTQLHYTENKKAGPVYLNRDPPE